MFSHKNFAFFLTVIKMKEKFLLSIIFLKIFEDKILKCIKNQGT